MSEEAHGLFSRALFHIWISGGFRFPYLTQGDSGMVQGRPGVFLTSGGSSSFSRSLYVKDCPVPRARVFDLLPSNSEKLQPGDLLPVWSIRETNFYTLPRQSPLLPVSPPWGLMVCVDPEGFDFPILASSAFSPNPFSGLGRGFDIPSSSLDIPFLTSEQYDLPAFF